MFARLKGIVDEIGADHAVIDVHGVGYLVQASRRTLGALGGTGAAATLHVETHVRENDIHLYGFVDRAERDWFRLLVTVQGVGAKVALAVLSVLDPSALAAAIAAQDARAPARATGVGPKLAKRIVMELKDKAALVGIGAADVAVLAKSIKTPEAAAAVSKPPEVAAFDDALSALVNLGYREVEAAPALRRVAEAAGEAAGDVQILLRGALKELAR
ncbi:MAG: Holliday junction branch migration protein RuvA [Tistrella sp.]|uniref:Holliday junction branch migration complex subunit RuvA n=1 Tax=Tistrella mobilis TaxID=171437 RepID=A0A3B9INY3_9PROT|nr:Holliday junction branch migration protein RuvA [Tistrella sp.]MAD40557.1 Holliday junction branch migration protein RuvA [Tistrella sp.]MBA78969.1 Holliday junction branch migration protein RuvA [Tistrella sp.]HAE49408.1 Holliday junction branch migration protein RuvA [Tistrella mobilis]